MPAVDARGIAPANFPEYSEEKAHNFYGRGMTGGEVGCYKSHLKAAEIFLASDAEYALVLEDDVKLPLNASSLITSLILQLKTLPDWELVNLGRAPHKMYTKLAAVGDSTLTHAHYFPVTTTALLWSRNGAEAFLNTRDEIYAPVDHFFRKWCAKRGQGFALIPAPFSTTGAESDIDTNPGAQQIRDRIRRTPAYFWHEFRRQSSNYANAIRHWTLARFF